MPVITEADVDRRCVREPFNTWTYHSRLSKQHRYVAVTTPKVACTAVKAVLHNFEGLAPVEDPHETGWELVLSAYPNAEIAEFLSSPDWLRFCFVRNPYDRLFSAWKSKIGNYIDHEYAPFREEMRAHYGYPSTTDPVPLLAFRDFADYIVSDIEGPYRLDPHWDRQVNILIPDFIQYDVVGRFESFATDFGQILTKVGAPDGIVQQASEVVNATSHVALTAAYDNELADRVYDHYRVDFETYGYDRESWRYHDGNRFA